jgi:hypothetical protein
MTTGRRPWSSFDRGLSDCQQQTFGELSGTSALRIIDRRR